MAGLRGEAVIEAAYRVASQSLQRCREEAAKNEHMASKGHVALLTQRMGKCVICGKKGPLGMECSRCGEDSGGRYL